ncbi:chromate transporter [Pseudooceanicola batsensis HTCC2597]|uniref:Chromate transporter n=1 Tax=Pseudooceanicola batsensis (strain ATCC BAA-863 / DSM 15984 / KCTC 12145 / HTCC2597) TaxID=252305 RepID=A3U411_PSEBH|nr:chromate efflux transporter [Pseudooceanicola batsensis]EAQ01058.1 chromate transporter [Pseudooceanicola batsensis HTCC2597]
MPPTWTEMFRAFGRIGLLSFGGPAAQISVMHEELVARRAWMSERDFLGALSFCMLLPGPEAMQLATYAGWRQRGTAGGLLAGLLFTLPGALVILGLAFAYARWGGIPLIQQAFLGVKALVIVIVLQALWRISRKALSGAQGWILAALAFLGLFALDLPFPLIILAAGLWGYLSARPAPDEAERPVASRAASLRTALIWLALWMAPLALVALAGHAFLTDLALFFARLAVVTFGGAYAVLAYMAQAVVETHGWIGPDAMIDALGLAETTPGPLILVTQFIGHLAGIGQGGPALGLGAGLLTLWMTFTPCFLWIFAFAPHVEAILANPRLRGALAAITAAVVGVILNLSLWFALHVLFRRVEDVRGLTLPDPASFDLFAASLTCLAAGLLFGLRTGLMVALPVMALAAAAAALIP